MDGTHGMSEVDGTHGMSEVDGTQVRWMGHMV